MANPPPPPTFLLLLKDSPQAFLQHPPPPPCAIAVPPRPIATTIPRSSGTTLSSVFKYGRSAITKPVAAASIGQVYKVELAEGGTVAIKVQRPGLLRLVSLDLFIVQSLLDQGARVTSNKQFAETCSSTNGVIGEWATRFIQELDYRQEAINQVWARPPRTRSRA